MKIPPIPEKEFPKFVAALNAVEYVMDGMKLGLGTGSTAYWFVILLAQKIAAEGLKIECVTTSSQTEKLALEFGIATTTLDKLVSLDLVIDGADEISPRLELIKGGGAALLQEKIVASAARKMIVIADESKTVDTLGKFLLPVEVVKFGYETTRRQIENLLEQSDVKSAKTSMRESDDILLETDEKHYIVDCHCEKIGDADALMRALNLIPGVVENGLFINMAETAIIGMKNGRVKIIHKDGRHEAPIEYKLPEGAQIIQG